MLRLATGGIEARQKLRAAGGQISAHRRLGVEHRNVELEQFRARVVGARHLKFGVSRRYLYSIDGNQGNEERGHGRDKNSNSLRSEGEARPAAAEGGGGHSRLKDIVMARTVF